MKINSLITVVSALWIAKSGQASGIRVVYSVPVRRIEWPIEMNAVQQQASGRSLHSESGAFATNIRSFGCSHEEIQQFERDKESLRHRLEYLEVRLAEMERSRGQDQGRINEPQFSCLLSTPLNGSFFARDRNELAAKSKVLEKCEARGTAFCPFSKIKCEKDL